MRQHCGQGQGVRPPCASDSPWARPGVRTGRAGNLRPAASPPGPVLGFSPPAPPLPPRWGGPGPDLCVRENTAQAASVEFCRIAAKLCAQQTAILLSGKTGGFFRQFQEGAP